MRHIYKNLGILLFDLSSTFSEEKSDLIKEKYTEDYNMSYLLYQKIKKLPQKKYIIQLKHKNIMLKFQIGFLDKVNFCLKNISMKYIAIIGYYLK